MAEHRAVAATGSLRRECRNTSREEDAQRRGDVCFCEETLRYNLTLVYLGHETLRLRGARLLTIESKTRQRLPFVADFCRYPTPKLFLRAFPTNVLSLVIH